MNLATTLLFYGVIGAAVAVAVYLSFEAVEKRQRWLAALTAVAFWPLYLPLLLRPAAPPPEPTADQAQPPPRDALAAAIEQVEAELDLALQSLDGWSDAVLAREQHRFAELRAAWHAQAEKIRQLDLLLAQPEYASDLHGEPQPAAHARDRARQANIARLRALRDKFHAELTGTLAWVRELVTMIHLAKYTGAPASRAEELVMQIATSVEGLSEVAAWQGAESAGNPR